MADNTPQKPQADSARSSQGRSGQKNMAQPETPAVSATPIMERVATAPQKKEPPILKPIRTYKSDIAAALKKGQSLTRIAMAEIARKEKRRMAGEVPTEKPKAWRTTLLVAGSIALFLAGLGAIAFAVFFRAAPTERPVAGPSMIFAESQDIIVLDEIARRPIITHAQEKIDTVRLPINHVKQIVFAIEELPPATTEDEAPTPIIRPLTTSEFLDALETSMRGSLLRSLNQSFFFGLYGFGGNNPFLILQTRDFDTAFAGMLAWEARMARDLAPILAIANPPVGTPFRDEVFKNLDIRVLESKVGETVLLYVFVNTNRIIVATDRTTLDEVSNRIKAAVQVAR